MTHQQLSVTEAETMLLHEPARANQYWQQFATDEITRLTQKITDAAPTKAALKAQYDTHQAVSKGYGTMLVMNDTLNKDNLAEKARERLKDDRVNDDVVGS